MDFPWECPHAHYLLKPTYEPLRTNSTDVDSQIVHKMPDLGYPFRTTNGMLYCKKKQPWLLECFKTVPRYIRQKGGASDSINQLHILSHCVIFCLGRLSNCTQNVRFGVPSQNGMLLECVITILWCRRQMGGVSDSIYQPLMGHTVPFPPTPSLK